MTGQPQREVKFVPKPGFKYSFRRLRKLYPEIREAMKTFNDYKREIPPKKLPRGMRDHLLSPPLEEYRECHLSGDVLLLYTHESDIITLYKICTHDEIDGKRGRNLRNTLSKL